MVTESAPKGLISQEQLEADIKATIERNKELEIVTEGDFITAQEALKAVKGKIKQVKEWFAPMVKKAHEAHKEIKGKENEFVKPLEEISSTIGVKCGAFQAEAEERARKERAKEEERLRKEAEEKKAEEAVELEAAGKTEEAEAKLDEPVYVPPPPVKEPAKVSGVSYRTTWKFEIQNRELIPTDFMIPDEKKIGGYVRSMKEAARIPGVRIFPIKTPIA